MAIHLRLQFGNLVGESGDAPGAAFAVVGLADVLRSRARQSGAVGVAEWCDFNRDGRVNALDLSVARAHVGHGLAMPGVSVAGEGVVAAPGAGRGPAPRRLWYEVAACGLASDT